jgi:ADP-heptose:LPS heptosyltransferase
MIAAADRVVTPPLAHGLLRQIDCWIGIPLCALASCLRRIGRQLARPATIASGPRNALFVQLAESGSMVLADPAMREMAEASGARLHCVTFAANAASLRLTGTIAAENVFPIRCDSPIRLLIDGLRFLFWCRQRRIDTVIDCELFSRLTAVLCWLTSAERRAGFQRTRDVGLYRGDLYTHPVAFDPRLHIADNFRALVRALHGVGVAEPDSVAALPTLALRDVAPDESAALRSRLAAWLPAGLPAGTPLLLVNANASDVLPQRRWPAARFAELIGELLARQPALRVLLIGAAGDASTTAAIAAAVADPRCTDIAGRLQLAELPTLFAVASALVTNDSGPAHFAAVTALPTVVLFGPETPTLFGPLNLNAVCLTAGLPCSPCVNVNNQRRTRCTDNRCMTAIPVMTVRAAIEPMLHHEPTGNAEAGPAPVLSSTPPVVGIATAAARRKLAA